MSRESVVRISDHKASHASKRRRQAAALIEECARTAANQLAGAFPAMMDKVDDALFDRVDKSENANDHSVYFDTMREMRLKRTAIEAKFKERFIELARECLGRTQPTGTGAQSPAGELTLGLVDETDLEESLAVTNMVAKVRSSCNEQLFALDKRMAHLLGQKDLKSEDNPLGPEPICQAFKDACGEVETTLEAKLLILKLFDRHVVSEVEGIYQQINQHLADKKILPNIRAAVAKKPSESKGGAKNAPSDADRDPVLDALRPEQAADAQSAELLGALKQVMSMGASEGASVPPGPAGEQQARVIGNLTRLQHGKTEGGDGELPTIDPSLLAAGNTNVVRELKSTGMTEGMGQIDVVMFDVVAMMFDFILDDRNVPDPMKALIGRLQIPVLKVALMDKSFFAKKHHPVRKLLNALAEAAVGWSETHDDDGALYGRIESFVRRVLEEFDNTLDVFEKVLVDLESFLEEHGKHVEENAEPSAQALEGRERLAEARARAHEVIAERFAEATVPDVVRKFFEVRWKELLVFRYFEEGEDGEGWKDALKTMDELIWSLTPITTPEDRNKLLRLLPGLLNRIKAGMDQITLHADERKSFLAALASHHLSVVRSGGGEPPAAPGTDEAAAIAAAAETDHGDEVRDLLRRAVERANAVILQAAESKPECAGMGTTLVAARFYDNRVAVAHVGDSRMYRLHDGRFEQITCDHSLVQELVAKGFYTLDEAKEKVKSNVITRAVGVEEWVAPDVQEVEATPGDLFLLCSDGLTDMVSDTDIYQHLTKNAGDLVAASECLVELANRNGGKDNISVVIARVVEPYPANGADGNTITLEGQIDITGLTDVGRRRSHNEDGIAVDPQAGFAVVADGMGGCNAGEVASALALQIITRALRTEIERAQAGEDDMDWLFDPAQNAPSEEIAVPTTLSPDDEYVELVESLDVGVWMEFKQSDGTATRARLTWISAETGRYLFTDIAGVKVLDATPHALAAELQRGNATVIDDEPLVDRVMGGVTDRLQSGGAPKSAH